MKTSKKLICLFILTLLLSINSQAQMKIVCQQKGVFIATFKISYTNNGQRYEKESEHLAVGTSYQVMVPYGAQNISIRTAIMYFIGNWHEETRPVNSGGIFVLSGALHNEGKEWKPDPLPTPDDFSAAIRSNDKVRVNWMLSRSSELLNKKNGRGQTPLHQAIETQNLSVVENILKKKPHPYMPDNLGQRPLDLAAALGNIHILKMLFEYGVKAEGGEKNLSRAVQEGREEIVFLFLNHGINARYGLEAAMKYDKLPLYERMLKKYNVSVDNAMFEQAISQQKFHFANRLLDESINMNQALEVVLKTKQSELIHKTLDKGADANIALKYAIESEDHDLAKEAIHSYEADPNPFFLEAVNPSKIQLMKLMLENGANPDLGMSRAIASNYPNILGRLVEAGANANEYIKEGVESGNIELVKILLAGGASPDEGLSIALDNKGFDIALHLIEVGAKPVGVVKIAVEEKQTVLLRTALEKGADPNPGLGHAVQNNELDYVMLLLENGADATRGFFVETSAKSGNYEMTVLLLDAGSAPNPGILPAIERADAKLLRKLLNPQYKAQVRAAEYMEAAVNKQNASIVRILLDANANPNAGLATAIQLMNLEISEMLLEAGADASPSSYMVKASQATNISMVQLLLRFNADPNPGMQAAIDKMHLELAQILLKAGADASSPKFIEQACAKGNYDMASLLLDYQANPQHGMLAAVKNNHVDIVKLLIEAGADGSEEHLLIAAVPHNQPSLTALLFEEGAQPQLASKPAVNAGADKVLAQIVSMGVDVSDAEYLVVSVQKNYVKISKILLENGADPTVQNPTNGYTLLHRAAENNSPSMLSLLGGYGVDVNAQAHNGDTALHLAVRKGNNALGCVQKLIALSADVNARNHEGEIIFKAAKGRKLKKLLKENNADKK